MSNLATRPILTLPVPKVSGGRFEYQISDLVKSFSAAALSANERIEASSQSEPGSRRTAALKAIYDKSTQIVTLLEGWQASGHTHISTKNNITDGIWTLNAEDDNRFLSQHARKEISPLRRDAHAVPA